ncbi:hypothetical protein FUT69_04215 [Xylella taiwanensis]|uniref:hypothetical protein n=1 Tax=Xylella taiwanensis TaxID=1444770 RepID=UPI0004AF195E|nr:hypothetical protein [Xylella taiwanensis]AXI84402.1 hypothetical protein AB672_10915 [Xylella taiwanensis]MCD8469548.1 hypothetical protein [Xylella taiwanensis]NBI36423.1 hypothetical protein [Xylella taiwanensis]UFN28031.1 hypothetical protein LPH51_04810 [Xylella taiwanensis]UFN34737.1 hypothetical protein LPH40_04570 [Xylella taiwanensis]
MQWCPDGDARAAWPDWRAPLVLRHVRKHPGARPRVSFKGNNRAALDPEAARPVATRQDLHSF